MNLIPRTEAVKHLDAPPSATTLHALVVQRLDDLKRRLPRMTGYGAIEARAIIATLEELLRVEAVAR